MKHPTSRKLAPTLTLAVLGLLAVVVTPTQRAAAAGAVAFEKSVLEPLPGAPLGAGDLVTFELKVTCLSLEAPCGELDVVDQLPPGLTFVGAALPTPAWTQSVAGQTVTLENPEFLDGETAVIVLRARVGFGQPAGTALTNAATATISDPGPGLPGTATDDATVTITQPLEPAWSVRKTKVSPSGNPRIIDPATGQTENVRYRLEVCSNRASRNVDLTGISLTEILPPGATHLSSEFFPGWVAQPPFPSTVFTRPSLTLAELYGPNDAPTLTKCSPAGDIDVFFTGVTAADSRTNSMGGAGTFAGGLGPFGDTDSVTHGFRGQADGLEAAKGSPANANPGSEVSWTLTANPADFDVTTFVMEDVLDDGRPLWSLTTVRSGTWSGGIPAEIAVRVGGTYQALGTVTGGANTNFTELTPGVPLEGQAIDAVRWTFSGTVPAAFAFGNNRATIVQRVPADAAAGVVRNCVDATATSTQTGAPLTREACRDLNVVPVSLTPTFAKTITPQKPGLLRPGDFVDVTLTYASTGPGNGDIVNPIVTDLLPPELRFAGFDPNPPPPGVPTGSYTPGPIDPTLHDIVTETEIRNVGGVDREVVRFRWAPNTLLPDPPGPLVIEGPSAQVSVTFVARVTPGTPRGTYTNTGGVSATDPPTSCPGGGTLVTDTTDLAGTGKPEPTCTEGATFSVVGAAIMDAEKYSLGDPALGNANPFDLTQPPSSCPVADPAFSDPGYTRFPCVGQVLASGEFFFRVVLTNTGNQPLRDYIAYDVLPTVPDFGVSEVLTNASRETQWIPTLLDPVELVAIPDDPTVVVPPDAVIEYSASTNPCRPEMAAGPDGDWQDGVCNDDWDAALPGGSPANVRAWRLRVPFADPAWQPAQRMVLDLHFQAPPDAVPGEITWNSVAHRSTDAQSGSRLPTAEPRKVGIRVPASTLGGKAFRDNDRSGVFDDGDDLLPDVDVTLFDEDGNEVATTTTDADGNYVFPGLPPGRYRIQFDQSTFAVDDAIIPPGEGDDPTNDSDADPLSGSTGFIDLPPNVTDLTYNVGVRERVVALIAAKAAEGDITEESGTYLIEIANTGEDPTGPPVTVVDTLPTGLTFAGAVGDGWTCTAAGQVVTCTNPGPFAADADLPELRLAVDVTADPGTTVTNRVAVFSDPDAEAPDDEASADAVIVAIPFATTTTMSSTTTTVAATTTTRPGASGGRLPVVGSDVNAAVAGLVLVAAGTAMWVAARRRRPSASSG